MVTNEMIHELRIETKSLAVSVNTMHTFMATNEFYHLSRMEKDLLYAQQSAMMTYLQILGKRCELYGISLSD